jgi:hypothetical protein
MARVVLTYLIPGNVTVDLDSGEVIDAELDIYNYGDPDFAEFENSSFNDPKPTAAQKQRAEAIVTESGDWDWQLG